MNSEGLNPRTSVTFSYKKPKSRRTRYMKLDAEGFMSRFLQHSLPPGFMKVRYYGFMHPCSGVPLEKVRASIEMMHGFDVVVSEAPREVRERSVPICPDCGGELRYRCTVLPHQMPGYRGSG
ncbi:MAG: transposase [Desulfobacterales bacterium]|nr:transposase [Desulfobacterales bacterium]